MSESSSMAEPTLMSLQAIIEKVKGYNNLEQSYNEQVEQIEHLKGVILKLEEDNKQMKIQLVELQSLEQLILNEVNKISQI
jgi:Fic family protein